MMKTELQVTIDDGTAQREEIQEALDNLSTEEDLEISIEQPSEFLPGLGVGESLTLIIAVNSTITTFIKIYPIIRDTLSQFGGEPDIVNTTEVARSLIVNNTQASRDQLNLTSRELSGDYAIFNFDDSDTGSVYHIEINLQDPKDWVFEER